MRIFYYLIIHVFLTLYTSSYADNSNCKNFKKFSVEYFKCKGNLIKDKTMSAGQNIIKDTKDYQDEEWTEEKKKIKKTKKKMIDAKNKVLNK
jgi:hypothetical protein